MPTTNFHLICHAWNSLSSSSKPITLREFADKVRETNQRVLDPAQAQTILKTICLNGFGKWESITGSFQGGRGFRKNIFTIKKAIPEEDIEPLKDLYNENLRLKRKQRKAPKEKMQKTIFLKEQEAVPEKVILTGEQFQKLLLKHEKMKAEIKDLKKELASLIDELNVMNTQMRIKNESSSVTDISHLLEE